MYATVSWVGTPHLIYDKAVTLIGNKLTGMLSFLDCFDMFDPILDTRISFALLLRPSRS